MYIVRQTKGLDLGLQEIVHTNIRTLEEAVDLAERVQAKYVEKIIGRARGVNVTVKVWKNPMFS